MLGGTSLRFLSFLLVLVAVFLATATTSCSLARSPILPDDRMDAGGLDGGAMTLDAPQWDGGEIDGGSTGCTPACAGGQVCEGTTCVCPAGACCPGCDDSQTCIAESCVPCGAPTEPCCGGTCGAGAACAGGTCEPCGGEGQLCCGATCTGPLTCMSGRCAMPPPTCGGASQACCAGNTCATRDLICDMPLFGSDRCVPCGGTDQPCCTSGPACNDATDSCVLGDCRVCGTPLGACCPDGSCLFGSRCNDGSSGRRCVY